MIKQALLGSRIGIAALSTRSHFDLVKSAFNRSESIGTLMNDYLAGRIVTSICDSNKTFLDVGAHIGSIIAEVKHRSKPREIIAIEAIPAKAIKLVKKFPDVHIHNYAVSDSVGQADFYVAKQSGYSSLSKVNGSVKIRVNVEKIDNLIQSEDVDVIKIDIEGHELPALRGATNLIKDSSPVIMFESAPSQDDSKTDMWEFLTSLDYQVFIPVRLAHTAEPLSLNGFIDSHRYPRRTTNYFAVPSTRVEEARAKTRTVMR